MPKFRKTCSISNSAVTNAVGKVFRGINLQALEKQSMAPRIHVFSSTGGSTVTKSNPMCDQGRFRTGKGRVSQWVSDGGYCSFHKEYTPG